MEPSDQGSSRCNAVRVVSLLGKAGLTKLAAHRAEELIILRQRFHLMFETSVPQSHQTSFFREDAVFENRSSSRSSDNTWICGVSQSELGEYIGLDVTVDNSGHRMSLDPSRRTDVKETYGRSHRNCFAAFKLKIVDA